VKDESVGGAALHRQPCLRLRPKAREVRDIDEHEHRASEEEQVGVAQLPFEADVLSGSAVALRQAAVVEPDELDPRRPLEVPAI
jgi:hypothetical protein